MHAAPSRSPIQVLLDALHAKYADLHDGEVATYIPELAKADPELFGICLPTADGERRSVNVFADVECLVFEVADFVRLQESLSLRMPA